MEKEATRFAFVLIVILIVFGIFLLAYRDVFFAPLGGVGTGCGNKVCSGSETCASCQFDCGVCQKYGGPLYFFDDYVNTNFVQNMNGVQQVGSQPGAGSYIQPIALGGGEINPNSPIGQNLISLWRFDGNANDAVDSNNGVLQGGMNCNSAGQFGNACLFDGVNDYIEISNPPNLNLQPPFSIVLWVKTAATDIDGGDAYSDGDNLGIRIKTNGNVRFFKHASSGWIELDTVNVNVLNNVWNHIAAVQTASGMNVYVNGILKAANTNAQTVAYTIGPNLFIGKHGNGEATEDYNGLMDEAAAWGRALTPSEIQQLANPSSVYTGSFESVNINANQDTPVYSITPTWIATNGNVYIDISFNNGVNWISATNGQQMNIAGGAMSFRYRASFNSPTQTHLENVRFDYSTTPIQFCGNDIRELNEVCDGTDLDGMNCVDFNFENGDLGCNADCSGFDFSQCSTCQNGVREGAEQCDGSDIPQQCSDFPGYSGGDLGCDEQCGYDFSFCDYEQPGFCGNDVAEYGEQCDGTDLNEQSCYTLGWGGGNLACVSDCNFDTSGCTIPSNTIFLDKQIIPSSCTNYNPATRTCGGGTYLAYKTWSQINSAGLSPGDYVLIRGGTYSERMRIFGYSGTASQPIRIKTYWGEQVTFDGTGIGGTGIESVYGGVSYVQILGPIEVRNYVNCLQVGDYGTPNAVGWVVDKIDAHNCESGVRFHNVINLILKNGKSYRHHFDGRGVAVFSGTDILIENFQAYDNTDGTGANGDADGFWSPTNLGTAVLRNVSAWNNGEDGFDFKANDITIENAVSYNNGFAGLKAWYGNYRITNFLTYNNYQDGIKCELCNLTATNVVTSSNLQDGIRFAVPSAGPANIGLLKNVISYNNKGRAVWFARAENVNTRVDFINSILSHPNNPSQAIELENCPAKDYFSENEINSGVLHSLLSSGVDCDGNGQTIVSGSAPSTVALNPQFVNAPVAQSIGITFGCTGTSTLRVVSNTEYPFSQGSYDVGDWIEVNNDGILRQITNVNSVTHILTFSPAISQPLCWTTRLVHDGNGEGATGGGALVFNWGAVQLNPNEDYQFNPNSPAIDSGISTGAPFRDLAGRLRVDALAMPNSGSGVFDYYDRGVYEFY